MLLAAVALAWFLVLLDDTAVAIALPSIGRDLVVGLVGLEWTINVYTLTFAVLTLAGGLCVDRFGPRRVFLAGLLIFALASALAGSAPNGGTLIAARAVQGAAAALVGPAALAVVASRFEGRRRGVALGVWSAVGAGALATGPLLGALLTSYFSWRAIFLVNVPIVAFLLMAVRAMREEPRPPATVRSGRFDLAGLAASGAGLAALVLGLTEAGTYGWLSVRTWGMLGLALASLAGFVVVERRASAPVVSISLLRLPNVLTANVLGMLNLAVMCSLFFFLSLYLQRAGGLAPIPAGVALLPLSTLAAVVAPMSGWLAARVGARSLIAAGMGMTAVGLVVLASMKGGWGPAELLPGLVLTGAGIGLATAPVTTMAMEPVPQHQYGMASAILNAFRMVGLSLGVALMGTIVSAQWPRGYAAPDLDPARFATGLSNGFLLNAGVALGAAALVLVATRARPPDCHPVIPAERCTTVREDATDGARNP